MPDNNNSNKPDTNYDFVEDGEMYRIVEEETKKLGFFERLASVFVSPVQLMRNIKQKPSFGAPMLVLLAVSILAAIFSQQYTKITLQEMGMISLERYGVDYFNSAATTDALGAMAVITTISTFIGAISGYVITALISTLVLLIFTRIARGKAKFQQYFSMYLHAYIVSSLGTIVIYFTGIMMGSSLNMTSLAAIFMPGGNLTQPMYLFLTSINIFAIWESALVCIGIREINGFSTTKAFIIIAIMFALGCTVSSLMSYAMIFYYDWMHGMFSSIAHLATAGVYLM